MSHDSDGRQVDIHDSMEASSLQSTLTASRFIVAITGAGISKASGLPLGDDSVANVKIERLFDRDFYLTQTREYFALYRHVLSNWRSAIPNEAHLALAKYGVWVVTQNIDGLHRDAGTDHLLELHGNLRELICVACGLRLPSRQALKQEVPHCPGCRRVLEPGISLEGGEIRHFSLAVDWVGRAEALLVVGTSLDMEPVRQLPNIALSHGALVVRINQNAEHYVPRLFRG